MHDGRAGRRLTCRCERSRQPEATCNVGAHAAPPTRASYFSTRWPCTSAVGGGGWAAYQNGCKWWKRQKNSLHIRVNLLQSMRIQNPESSPINCPVNLVIVSDMYTQNLLKSISCKGPSRSRHRTDSVVSEPQTHLDSLCQQGKYCSTRYTCKTCNHGLISQESQERCQHMLPTSSRIVCHSHQLTK